jgi:hypothetical protein
MKTSRYLRLLLASVVMIGATAAAHAAACVSNLCDLGTDPASGTTIGNSYGPYSTAPYAEPEPGDFLTFKGVVSGSGSINTTWYFTTNQASLLFDHASIVQSGFTSFTAKLFDSGDNEIWDFSPGVEYFKVPLDAADLYHFVVTGAFTNGANYTFIGKVVPLPAAAWLLLSGVAGLGAMARRRKVLAEA